MKPRLKEKGTEMSDKYQELKEMIVEALNLDDVTADEIGTDDPLFVEGLGLDSIDALELAVAIERKYGIKLKMTKDVKEKFYSVKTLASLLPES